MTRPGINAPFGAVLTCIAMFAQPALADPCHDAIAALFEGGALDPFQRPPHRHETTVRDADGAVIRIMDAVIETPLRSMAGVRDGGTYALILDRRSWTGPTPDGPWAEAPNLLPEDRRAQVDRIRRQQQANLSDTECPGPTDLNGVTVTEYRYTTRTDPDDSMGGAWFGERNTVFIDPQSDRVLRWDMADFVNSWSQGTGTDRHVILFDYDPSIRLVAPDGS